MNKVKVEGEYFIDLLDKHKGAKRDKREEKGFKLLDKSPDFATDDNLWIQGNYERKIEGWEKLCIEAYLCGWIDFFDILAKVPDEGVEARTIYFKWEEGDKKLASLKVYLDPGPKNWPKPPAPPKTSSGISPQVPKPPPPPLG